MPRSRVARDWGVDRVVGYVIDPVTRDVRPRVRWDDSEIEFSDLSNPGQAQRDVAKLRNDDLQAAREQRRIRRGLQGQPNDPIHRDDSPRPDNVSVSHSPQADESPEPDTHLQFSIQPDAPAQPDSCQPDDSPQPDDAPQPDTLSPAAPKRRRVRGGSAEHKARSQAIFAKLKLQGRVPERRPKDLNNI